MNKKIRQFYKHIVNIEIFYDNNLMYESYYPTWLLWYYDDIRKVAFKSDIESPHDVFSDCSHFYGSFNIE